MNKIMECVPNFSEGRDKTKIEKIISCFQNNSNVKLLDFSPDTDHNRTVVTVVGEPDALAETVINAAIMAKSLIDLNKHSGQHPRMGSIDVVPFIPVQNVTEEDAKSTAEKVGKALWEQAGIPVFMYEKSARSPQRENLAVIRKGEFEGLKEKMASKEWTADYGGNAPHPTAGATVVGARMPLVAFNVNIASENLEYADKTAKKIRFIGGGLRYVKALGLELTDRKITQISMNLTDFTKTSIYLTFELIKAELKRYNAKISGCEIIGLLPYQAIKDVSDYVLLCEGKSQQKIDSLSEDEIIAVAEKYLMLENFSFNQVLERTIKNS